MTGSRGRRRFAAAALLFSLGAAGVGASEPARALPPRLAGAVPELGPMPRGVPATLLRRVEVVVAAEATVVRVIGDGAFRYATLELQDPAGFAVDLIGVTNLAGRPGPPVASERVRSLDVRQLALGHAVVTRVTLGLSGPAVAPVIANTPHALELVFATAAESGPAATPSANIEPAPLAVEPADPPPQADDYPRLNLLGFSDFGYGVFDGGETPAAESSAPSDGLLTGQMAFHLISRLAPQVTLLAEVALTAISENAGANREFAASIERAILKFGYRNWMQPQVGRFHTPINYWNVAYHHGQWLQTTISRPEMARFGGEFIPLHFVGGLLEGVLRAGGWNVGYSAGIGNGRGADVEIPANRGDVNGSRASLLSLFVRPARVFGLQVGAAVYEDRLSLRSLGGTDFDESILAAHVVWSNEDPEVISEFASVRHENSTTGETFDSDAFYLQLAYRLPFAQQKLKPYVRFEELDVEAADPVFEETVSQRIWTLGLRYDPLELVAIKAEVREIRSDASERTGAFTQVSFTF